MPTKKKISSETKSGLSTATAAAMAKKAPRAASAAATHKSATRKSAAPKARTKATTAPMPVVFDPAAHHEEIASAAYFLWLDRGAGPGSESEDWLQAVEIVAARYRG